MKIKAYTLMEVTVAMLLSAICISICYSAYQIITGYYTSFHQKNKIASEVLFLRHSLEGDFLKSKLVMRNEAGIVLQIDRTKVYYAFNENAIVRKLDTLPADTFELKTGNFKTYFEQQELVEGGRIDQLNFSIFLAEKLAVPIQVNTFYSAQDLFK